MKHPLTVLGALLFVSCAQSPTGDGEFFDDAGPGGQPGLGGAWGPAGGAGGAAGYGVGGAFGGGGVSGTGATTGGGGAAGSGGGAGGTAACSGAPVSAKAATQLATGEYQKWKAAHVAPCSATNSAVVINGDDTSGNWVVSEGIGYGMLLAVANDDRSLFDQLWKFYGDHLDAQGLMNWSVNKCDAPGNNNANAASDGDLDAAMALVQADAKWGGYKAQAVQLIGKIKKEETDSCPNGLLVLRPGDKFGGCSDPGNMGKVNPSYFAPGYYRVFAVVDSANAAQWTKLAADSYKLLAEFQSAAGGLVPEWGFYDGRTDGSNYGYNACRTPWRVATDYAWFCTPLAKTFLDAISQYTDAHGGAAGVPFDKNSAFVGGFALSGLSGGQAKLDGYVTAWLGAQLNDKPYFQGSLRVLYLELAAGKFASGI